MKFIEMTQGIKEVLFEGTEKEIIIYWNTEKKALTDWIAENGTEEEIKNRDELLSVEIGTIQDLDYILNQLNYSWWTLKVEEGEETMEDFEEIVKTIGNDGYTYYFNESSGSHCFNNGEECIEVYDYPADDGSDWAKINSELKEKFNYLF